MGNPHILIIDDDAGLLRALPEVLRLKMSNLVVETSNSPREALKRIAATDYDAVVSDIQMPSMDGLTLLGQIREIRPDTPVLLMTSHDDRDLVIYALRGGAYDFIQKPIDSDYFIVSLKRAIQMRQLSRQVIEQKDALERHADELEQSVKQAVAQAEAAQRRLAFLAEASTLLASSLDYEVTLSRVARLAVLYLADFCVVDIVLENAVLQCVGVAHVDRSQEHLVREMRKYYQLYDQETYPPYAVAQDGKAILVANATDLMLKSTISDAAQLEVLRELNPRGWMMIPLIAQERILGVLTFALVGTRRRYNSEDLALAEDLTRRAALAVGNARLYEETQQALQIRDHFLSIAAHELKTPMTSILGTSQLLLRRIEREGTLDERDIRRLRLLSEQTRRLSRLTGSLLDLSRLEMGQFTIDRNPLDLIMLVRRVTDEATLALEIHKIEITTSHESLMILGDELRLEQVIQNLLHNAIKYSPDGGLVRIEVSLQDAFICVQIIDQGIGIPIESQSQLFKRYYRAHNIGNRQISGLGLGLFVVKEIVDLHDGQVEVVSVEGEGSTFTIRVPLHHSPAPIVQEGEPTLT